MRRRPLLVAVVALTGLLAGIWFSGRGAEAYQATATIVVEDPRTTEANAIVLAPERYVAEQVAIFDLDTIATSAAEIATAEHQEALRQRSTSAVSVGDAEPGRHRDRRIDHRRRRSWRSHEVVGR